MNRNGRRLGMVLKGYPRISESFISTEILLLEHLGIPVDIYSLRQPREPFAHDHVRAIQAPITYLPEYVLPNLRVLAQSHRKLYSRLGKHYLHCLHRATQRAFERRKPATLRHFFQAGHLVSTRLLDSPPAHLHAHFCHTPTSVALFASELTGIPFSFTAHAKDIYTSEPDQLARKIRRARFVVTCTAYNARHLARIQAAYGGGTTSIHTIYHGIDLGLFTPAPRPASTPPYRILSVGRIVPKKGYDDLVKALSLLDHEGLDFQFVHIGSGEQESEITTLIQSLKLTGRVRMLGTLDHAQVIAYYRQAHCFALACKVASDGDRDGIPNVLVEAMAMGVPVATTRVSAIPELVENGATGTLVEPGDPAALAAAIRSVLLNPGETEERIKRARAKVEAEFDNRRCVMRLHALFQAMLDEP